MKRYRNTVKPEELNELAEEHILAMYMDIKTNTYKQLLMKTVFEPREGGFVDNATVFRVCVDDKTIYEGDEIETALLAYNTVKSKIN